MRQVPSLWELYCRAFSRRGHGEAMPQPQLVPGTGAPADNQANYFWTLLTVCQHWCVLSILRPHLHPLGDSSWLLFSWTHLEPVSWITVWVFPFGLLSTLLGILCCEFSCPVWSMNLSGSPHQLIRLHSCELKFSRKTIRDSVLPAFRSWFYRSQHHAHDPEGNQAEDEARRDIGFTFGLLLIAVMSHQVTSQLNLQQ